MTTSDALRLFEAVLTGELLHTPRRPHDRERDTLIQSGHVFIFEESSSGIKRWTDGQHWSPSRILGNFLIYRQLHQDLPPGEKKKAIKRKKDNDLELQEVQPDAAGPTDERLRALLGSLIDSYQFMEGGLIKKTISINFNDTNHHLVSYYSLDDALAGRLPTPSQDARLSRIRPRRAIMTGQDFRVEIEQEDPVLWEEVNSGMETTPYPYHPQPGLERTVSMPQMPTNVSQPYGTPGQFHMSMPMSQSVGPIPHMSGSFGHNANSVMAWEQRTRAQPMHHPYQPQDMVDHDSKRRRSAHWDTSGNAPDFYSPGGMAPGAHFATTGHDYYSPTFMKPYPVPHMPSTTMGSQAMDFSPALTSMAPPPQTSPVAEHPMTTMDFPPSMTAMAPMTTMDFSPPVPAMAPMTTMGYSQSAPARAPMAPRCSNFDGPHASNLMTSLPAHSGSPMDGPAGLPNYFSPFNTAGWNHAPHDSDYMAGHAGSFHNGWPHASSPNEQQH